MLATLRHDKTHFGVVAFPTATDRQRKAFYSQRPIADSHHTATASVPLQQEAASKGSSSFIPARDIMTAGQPLGSRQQLLPDSTFSQHDFILFGPVCLPLSPPSQGSARESGKHLEKSAGMGEGRCKEDG